MGASRRVLVIPGKHEDSRSPRLHPWPTRKSYGAWISGFVPVSSEAGFNDRVLHQKGRSREGTDTTTRGHTLCEEKRIRFFECRKHPYISRYVGVFVVGRYDTAALRFVYESPCREHLFRGERCEGRKGSSRRPLARLTKGKQVCLPQSFYWMIFVAARRCAPLLAKLQHRCTDPHCGPFYNHPVEHCDCKGSAETAVKKGTPEADANAMRTTLLFPSRLESIRAFP